MKGESNYKSIVKGTAIFGGTQVFNIIVNLIKGKLVAIFLGPEGMGISSLLNSAINPIQQFSSLGLSISIVREISASKENDDSGLKESQIVSITRSLLRVTALLGAVFCIIFSGYISNWTFGSSEYKWHFVFLSVVVALKTMSDGEQSILQGTRALKRLAFSSIIGSCTGLLVGVPLYYVYGYDGIVPSMIVLSLATYCFYRYNTYKLIAKKKETVERAVFIEIAKRMIGLGLVSMVAILLGNLTIYALNTFIRKMGSVTDVGLYQAANSITNQYVGLVFSAMAIDYFPRLAAVQNDKNKQNEIVNQQTEIVLLIVAPLASLLIITSPLLIKILLTENFYSIINVIRWMGLAIFFKAMAFPMGYISYSKGDKKTFFWFEGILGNIIQLTFGCFLYYQYGLLGLGVSYLLTYIYGVLAYIVLTKKKYCFQFEKEVIKLIAVLSVFMALIFISSFIANAILSYTLMLVFLIVLSAFCLLELNKRIDIKGMLSRFKPHRVSDQNEH